MKSKKTKKSSPRKSTPRKRNPQDATNRNVRAANKKIAELQKRMDDAERRIQYLITLHPAILSGGPF
jgi:hypothetical protein